MQTVVCMALNIVDNKMYTLRLTRYKMFIRAVDGCCTDNKASAILFNTVEEARAYVLTWRVTSTVSGSSSMQVSIVEVQTKLVVQKVGKEVEVI